MYRNIVKINEILWVFKNTIHYELSILYHFIMTKITHGDKVSIFMYRFYKTDWIIVVE